MKKPIIFLAFANEPLGSSGHLRHLPDELRGIRRALGSVVREELCEIVERANVTIDEIFDIFQDKRYHNRIAIFHYGGHAGSYQLLLESEAQNTVVAHSEGLLPFLSRQQSLRLVFLNGCSTEQQAQSLLLAGLPVVIGTGMEIKDRVATMLAIQFYKGLAQGFSFTNAWEDAVDKIKTTEGDHPRCMYQGDIQHSQFPWVFLSSTGSVVAEEWKLPLASGNPFFGLPPIPANYDLPEVPFRYLSRFERQHAPIFFGRGAEISLLYEKVTASHFPAVVLVFGQSGVGKSSLLEAGLLPRLENSYTIYYVRRSKETGSLNDLIQILAPSTDQSLLDAWHQKEKTENKPLLIVLDQLEEVYTRPNANYPDEKFDFFNALQNIFASPDKRPKGKIILGYRKEYHPEIEAQLSHLGIARTKVFVKKLNESGIIEAVEGLSKRQDLQQHYGLWIKKGDRLPEIIAADLLEDSSSAIAPVLQILLTKMWEAATQLDESEPCFYTDLYQRLKREGLLLSDFINQKIAELALEKSSWVNSGLVLDILAFHTTPLGTADQHSPEEIHTRYAHDKDSLNTLLQSIKDKYLLADTPTKGKTEIPKITLAHDTLAPLIRALHESSNHPGQRADRILKNKLKEWEQAPQKTFLDDNDLQIIEQGKPGMRLWRSEEITMVNESKARQSKIKRNKNNIRLAFWTGGILLLILFILSLLGLQDRKRAKASKMVVEARYQAASDPTTALKQISKALNLDKSNRTTRDIMYEIYRENMFYQTLLEVGSSVNAAAFSSEGQYLALLTNEKNLRVSIFQFDAAKKKYVFLKSLEGPISQNLSSVVFSSDDQYILAGSGDRNVYRWELHGDGAPTVYIKQNTEDPAVSVVTYSNDGSFFAAGYQAEQIGLRIWAPTGQLLQSIPMASPVSAIAISPDNQKVLAGLEHGGIRLLKQDGTLLFDALVHQPNVNAVAISPTGDLAFTGASDEAFIWSIRLDSLVLKKALKIAEGSISTSAFSADGKMLLIGTTEGHGYLWDVHKGSLLYELKGHKNAIQQVAFSKLGDYIYTASRDSSIRRWPLFYDLPYEAFSLGFANTPVAVENIDDEKLLVASANGRLFVLDHSKDSLSNAIPVADNLITKMSLSSHGVYAAIATEAGMVYCWNVNLQEEHGSVSLITKQIKDLAFSPDNKYLMIASNDSTLILWNLTSKDTAQLSGHQFEVNAVDFSEDGNHALSAGWDKQILRWKIPEGQQLKAIQAEYPILDAEHFSHKKGNDFVVLVQSGQTYSYSFSGKKDLLFTNSNLQYLSVGNTGQYIFTAGGKNLEVRSQTGELIRTFQSPSIMLSYTSTSNDQFLFSGCVNDSIYVWRNDRLPVMDFLSVIVD